MRFLFVDRIDGLERGRWIEARKVASFEEAWLPRPTGSFPAMPPALLLEALLQAGMWLLRDATDFACQPIVTHVEGVSLGRPVRAGESVRLRVEVRQMSKEGAVLRGNAHVGSEQVAAGERIVCAFLPLERFEDPPEARTLFGEMRIPKYFRLEQR